MAIFQYGGWLRYIGNYGTISLDSVGTGVSTVDDLEADNTFEDGDGQNGLSNGPYAGQLTFSLSSGGTVTLPAFQHLPPTVIFGPPSGPNTTTFYVPTGVDPNDIVVPASLQFSSIINTPFTVCFAAGTRIATPAGECRVEALQIGETICNAAGGCVRIKWIGRQTVMTFGQNPRVQPVRIRAGALGEGLPYSDLTVTADHGMVVDGYVINASALVNGDTIDFVPLAELDDSFTVYHIETDAHDVILANGAASETFIDAAGRAAFDNHQEYLDLYGAERIIPEMRHPRIAAQRLLPQSLKDRFHIQSCALSKVG